MLFVTDESVQKNRLQQRLILISFTGLLLVALSGVLLRGFPFLSSFPLTYKNLLHGHSHFAFYGWVMPVILGSVMKTFPVLKEKIAFAHWRNIAVLVLISGYGMLISFPLQGYGPISISFSLLSIVAAFYLAVTVFRAAKNCEQSISLRFLKWGLVYGCLSSLGPIALGPLAATGNGGSPIYFDAIYFYLHFQYNGLFTFTVLALLYKQLKGQGYAGKGKLSFWLFNSGCLLTYSLSVLWSEPSILFNWVGGVGALLQLAGIFCFVKEFRSVEAFENYTLVVMAIFAFILKNVLQLLSAFPLVAMMAYHNQNFVIAYLHLVLLGFVTVFFISRHVPQNLFSRIGITLFLFSFITTECLLVLNATSGMTGYSIPYFVNLLLYCSLPFPVGIAFIIRGIKGTCPEYGKVVRQKGITHPLPAN